MNTNETVVVSLLGDRRTMDEVDEDSYGDHLSDDDILMAFLSDGCDLDGTPLLMMDEQGTLSHLGERAPTLH